MRRRNQLLKKALREEEGDSAEAEATEQSEEAPRVAKPAKQKLDPQKMAQELDTAKANLEQVRKCRVKHFILTGASRSAHCQL